VGTLKAKGVNPERKSWSSWWGVNAVGQFPNHHSNVQMLKEKTLRMKNVLIEGSGEKSDVFGFRKTVYLQKNSYIYEFCSEPLVLVNSYYMPFYYQKMSPSFYGYYTGLQIKTGISAKGNQRGIK
jgi:hypothetical protein